MAEYDGSIRINTKIETSGIKKDVAEIQKEIENLKDAQKSFLEAGGSKTSPAYIEYAKSLEKAQKEFETFGNTQPDIEFNLEHWNMLKVDVDEYAKTLKELESQGKYFGDEDFDQVYLAWKNASDAVKAYRNELNQQSAAVREVLQEQASEENRLSEIKNNATVSDEKTVALLERQKALVGQLKDLEKAGVGEGYEEYDQTYIAWKNTTEALKEYQSRLNRQTEAGQAKEAERARIEAERQAEAQRRAEEQAEKALQKENARIQKEIENEAKLQAKEAERQAKIDAEAAEEERLAGIRNSAVVNNQHIVDVLERRKQLLAEIKDLEAAGVTAGYQDYDSKQQELAALNSEIKDYSNSVNRAKESYRKLGDTAKKSMDKVGKSVKKSNGLLSSMFSRLKKLALSLLIFQQISKAFRAMISGMQEGFQNFYSENANFKGMVDSLKASLSTLKNSIAAAFSPLVEFAIPYIQRAIEYLTRLFDLFGQFVAAATGQKKYTKAVKQTTDALEDESEASNMQLSSLDKLNNLSSGGSESETSGGTMFEEVPIDSSVLDFTDRIKEQLQSAVECVRKLKDAFSQGFGNGLGDWEYRWESVKESITSIKDSVIDIFTDPAVLSSADGWAQSVSYMLGSLTGATASIGLTIADNILGGLSKYLEQNSGDIKEYLVSMFDIWSEINDLFSELFDSIAYVFEAFSSKNGQQLTANIIGIFGSAFMGVTELAWELTRDIAGIFIQPFVENKEAFRTALEGFWGVLSEVTGTIKQGIDDTFAKLNEVYEEHFKPFFDSLASGLSDTVGKFLSFWNNSVQPVLDEWAANFDALWQEHIQPMIDKFLEMLGSVADYLKALWEEQVKPFIDWIIENVLPVLLPILDGIVKAVFAAVGMVADIIGGIMDVIGGILDFLVGIFTGDWEKAWDGIVKIFDGVWGAIKGIVNGILGVVESLANGVVKGINVVIGALNNLSFDIPDWIPGLGGKTFGFNIPELKQVSIPRLATGTVVPPNKEFMAVLGDNKKEPEIVSPISTMKQALGEVLAEAIQAGLIGGDNQSGDIVVEVDGRELLRAMRKQAREYKKQTGSPAFG